VLLCMYLVVAEKQGVPFSEVGGTIQNDILKEYIARGTYIYPPDASMRLITDIFAYCAKEVPNWNTISISGYHIREAGSTAAQELAFTLADGIAYVQAAVDAGLAVDDFGPRLAFFWNGHNDFLEEIAKFRAARRMWHTIMTDRFGAKDPRSTMLRFHTQTAGSTLTAQQPENNVVRVAIQALAAVLGGTQSLHTNGMDEALGLPTEKAARIALRTQQIIANESGVTNTVDPVAGSYAIEALTNEMEREAFAYIKKIDDMGGMLAAIEKGWVQAQIQDAAYNFQREVEEKNRIVVGLNEFQVAETDAPEFLKLDESAEKAQLQKLAQVRASRNPRDVARALEGLKSAAQGTDNVLPFILAAVRAYATLGEISDTLRDVWGEYQARA